MTLQRQISRNHCLALVRADLTLPSLYKDFLDKCKRKVLLYISVLRSVTDCQLTATMRCVSILPSLQLQTLLYIDDSQSENENNVAFVCQH